jgi:hypothetical protein
MNPQDENRDELADAYRKASADEAGRPGAALRDAILAEAAAAARRRVPAANDSRYLWRGVAGLAVFGFALLIWQQVDHQLPGDAPTVVSATSEIDSAMKEEAAPMSDLSADAAPRAAAPPEAPPPQRTAAPSASAAEERELQEAPVRAAPSMELRSQAPEQNDTERAAGKVSALVDAQTDADALLRLYFPQQYESNTSHRVWLVQDGTGARLLSGELAPGTTHADLRLEIERALGGRLLRPWRIRSLQNARGQTIEFAIAQTP